MQGATLAAPGEDGSVAFVEGDELLRRHPEPRWWDKPWEDAMLDGLRALFGPADLAEAHVLHRDVIEMFRTLGDDAMLGIFLATTIFRFTDQPDYEDFLTESVAESVRVGRRTGFRQTLGHGLLYSAMLARSKGEEDTAIPALREGSEVLLALGDRCCHEQALALLAHPVQASAAV